MRYESLPAYLKKYPMTSVLIGLCITLFILVNFFSGTSSSLSLYQYGAFYPESVKDGQWYRFATAIFLHDGWMHLLMNLFFLYVFGPGIETLIGKMNYSLFFVLSGACSFILPFFFSGNTIIVGASGSLYGLMAMYLFWIRKKPYSFSEQDKQTVIGLIVVSFIFSFLTPGVSILGHAGGFVFGWILSYLFIKK